MVLRMKELGEKFDCIFTPAGNELPELFAHVDRMEALLGKKLIRPPAPSLFRLIAGYDALPNWRQRWCTRQIKIEPCEEFLKQYPGSTLCVGLRADEEERKGGVFYDCIYRRPLSEWGWGINEVVGYLDEVGIEVPSRTDCALCFGQQLPEWYALWKNHPNEWAWGVRLEEMTGHTFRSPGRDSWPAPLIELAALFAAGRRPRGVAADMEQMQLWDCKNHQRCRICSM